MNALCLRHVLLKLLYICYDVFTLCAGRTLVFDIIMCGHGVVLQIWFGFLCVFHKRLRKFFSCKFLVWFSV